MPEPRTGAAPVADARADESGVSRRVVTAVALGGVLVVLAIQNSASARVHLLFWQIKTPMYGVVVISALFGIAMAEAAAGLWRHRRRLRDQDRRELTRLRRRPQAREPRPGPG